MKKIFKFLLFFIVFTIFILGILIPVVNLALTNESFRNTILHRSASALDGKLQAKSLSIALDEKSLNISATELKGVLLGNTLLLDIPVTTIRIPFAELFQGSFFPSTFKAVSPHITIDQQHTHSSSPSARFNWSGEINTVLKKIIGNRADINVSNATLVLDKTTLNKLSIKTSPENSTVTLNVQTEILRDDFLIPVTISGTAGNPLTAGFSYDLDVQARSIPLRLIPGIPEFYFSGGTANFSGRLFGSGKDINIAGKADIADLDMTVSWKPENQNGQQEKPYLIAHSVLKFNGSLQNRRISLPNLDLQGDDFGLQGSFLLDFKSLTNPLMDLRLTSDEMEVATLKKLLPDPLINDWTTSTIFPRIQHGTARITGFKLAGTVDEISNMDQPGNYHCLSWSGILKNVDTFYNDQIPLARVHTAEISMDGDLLTIHKMEAESEDSTLRRADVFIDKLYEQKLQVRGAAEGNFSLAWLTKILKSGLLGESIQQEVSPISVVTGQVDGNIELIMEVTADEAVFNNLSGKGSTGVVDLQLTTMPLTLHMKNTDFILAFPGTCTLSGKGMLGKSPFNGTLNLIDLYRKQKFRIHIEPNLTELKKMLPRSSAVRLLAPCVQTIPVTADIFIEKNRVQAKGNILFNKLKINTEKSFCTQKTADNELLQADYALTYHGNEITLNNLIFRSKKGIIKASAILSPDQQGKHTLKKLRLHAADFPLKSLAHLSSVEQASRLGGTLDADLNAAEITTADLWSSMEGHFSLNGWQGAITRPALTIDNLDLEGTLDRGIFTLQGTDLRVADFNDEYPLVFTADLDKKDLWNGKIRFYGDYIDLTGSPSLFRQGKTVFTDKLPIGLVKIIGRIDHIRYRNILFSPLLLQTYFTENKIIIAKSLLQQENDFIWLTGQSSGNDVLYESYFKLREKPVKPLLAMMGFESRSITGSLDMEGDLTAKVTPGSTIFETSSGPVYFDVKDGTMVSSLTLIKILDLVSLENIFNKNDVLRWKDTLHFKDMQGKFDLSNGIFTTSSFIMDASAFDLFAEGTFNAVNETLNMKVKLAPFGTLNKLFSAIPYLGFVLTGKSKSLFDYTLSVTGKMEDPDVKYVPLKGTLKSLTGYIKRLVSAREDVEKEINSHLQEDMARKNGFILRMENEISPLKSL